MANPAGVSDLELRWRPLSAQETINGQTFLDDAWGMLRRRIPTIEADMVGDADLTAEVVRILATAVLRVMRNPEGARRESIDDYSWERDEAVAAGLLYFTDLDGLTPGSSSTAFTIRPFGEPGYSTEFDAWDTVP